MLNTVTVDDEYVLAALEDGKFCRINLNSSVRKHLMQDIELFGSKKIIEKDMKVVSSQVDKKMVIVSGYGIFLSSAEEMQSGLVGAFHIRDGKIQRKLHKIINYI